jgi:hypothetical protein
MNDLVVAIEQLEAMVGASLPDDYRRYLLAGKGGFYGEGMGHSPEDFWFSFKLQKLYQVADLSGQKLPHDSVQSWREDNPEWVSADLVRFPIGYDHGGYPFYIHLTGEKAGHVFTWVDAASPLEEVDLASSFTEFSVLAGLGAIQS